MTVVKINGRALPFKEISIRQSLSTIASATITFPFSFVPRYRQYIEIFDDYDFPIFRGYIWQTTHIKSATKFQTQVTAYDPLILLKVSPFVGSYSGTLKDLTEWIADFLGVTPAVQSDAKVNVHYDKPQTKWDLLLDAFHFAGTSFYYSPHLNELREAGAEYPDKLTILAFSWSKRVELRIKENTDIVNVVKVTNVEGS